MFQRTAAGEVCRSNLLDSSAIVTAAAVPRAWTSRVWSTSAAREAWPQVGGPDQGLDFPCGCVAQPILPAALVTAFLVGLSSCCSRSCAHKSPAQLRGCQCLCVFVSVTQGQWCSGEMHCARTGADILSPLTSAPLSLFCFSSGYLES